jgi:aminoglycoside phosphotransferase (APT) family kinase protein
LALDASLAELCDLAVLGRWMDEQGLPPGEIERVSTIAGGTQNVMLRLARGGREYVLRRPPRHLRPTSNEALRREGRVLAALAGSAVPHPRFVAGCFDESVMGGFVFYLMDPVAGFNAMTGLPALHAGDAGVRHAMGIAAAEAIARLALLDHRALALGDLGKPEGFLERQVPRWRSELDSYARHPGYPGPEIPELEFVSRWLERERPAQTHAGIVHGDYHLGNLLFANDGPELVAVVDWEMSTLGDPLLDLGWLVATWPDAEGFAVGPMASFAALGGWPSPAELAAQYAATTGRDVSALDWYAVLAAFKLGIILEGTHARAFAGKAPKATGDFLHAVTLALFKRARARIEAL